MSRGSGPRHEAIRRYFQAKLDLHGATPRGADWNSAEPQELRFRQLARLLDRQRVFSILDYGCGYGALVDFLDAEGYRFEYHGFDLVDAMVEQGRSRYARREGIRFFSDPSKLRAVDYAVASGTFNQKGETSREDWTAYVLEELATLHGLSRRGFASNFLTSYSDPEHMRPDLYYADPCRLFDHAWHRFARNVAILHDYGAYDFTLLVRK